MTPEEAQKELRALIEEPQEGPLSRTLAKLDAIREALGSSPLLREAKKCPHPEDRRAAVIEPDDRVVIVVCLLCGFSDRYSPWKTPEVPR